MVPKNNNIPDDSSEDYGGKTTIHNDDIMEVDTGKVEMELALLLWGKDIVMEVKRTIGSSHYVAVWVFLGWLLLPSLALFISMHLLLKRNSSCGYWI